MRSRSRGSFTGWLARWCAVSVMLLGLITASPREADGRLSGSPAAIPSQSAPAEFHDADLRRVLSVIESRMTDERVRERAREKLAVLGVGKLRLAASLCERIEADDHGAGADIAFSLVTALIILS